MLNKKDLDQINKTTGEVRGVVFKTDLKYVEKVKGKKGVEKIKNEIQKIEPDFKHSEIKNLGFYPLKWRALVLLIIKESFNWSEADLHEMGRTAPTHSFIIKTLLRYFISFKKTCHEAPTYWNKHYNRGKFELAKFDEDEKIVIFRLHDLKIHPVMCPYLSGYFQGVAELTNRSPKVKCREEKCMFKGDDLHEFVIRW